MIKRLLIIYLLAFSSHMCPAQLVCSFSATDTSGCAPLVVTFTDNSSGTATAWYWNFGNGDTSTQKNSVEAFNDTGTFNILHVVSNGVIYDSASLTIRVNAGANANFSPSSIYSNCPPFPVQFSNLATDSITHSLWSFGDGDTSLAEDPFHIYIYPGNYSVTLNVRNKYGCIADTTLTNLIQIKGPVGHFAAAPPVGCVPLTVNFTGTTQSTQSSIFVPGPGAVYNNQINVQYTFINSGEYEPTYTLTDSFGCTVPYPLRPVIVGAFPYQNLTDTTICKGNNVQFNLPPGDSLQIAETFNWSSNSPNSYLSCDTCGDPLGTSPDTITYYVTSTSYYAANNDTAVCMAKDTFVVSVDADSCAINGILPVNTPIVSIVPNPAANFVQINATGIFNLNVFNTTGDICLKKEKLTLPANIDISQFLPGLYVLALFNTKTDEATTYKLVVDK